MKIWLCDGEADCADGEDESSAAGCETNLCSSKEFQCKSGLCVSKVILNLCSYEKFEFISIGIILFVFSIFTATAIPTAVTVLTNHLVVILNVAKID